MKSFRIRKVTGGFIIGIDSDYDGNYDEMVVTTEVKLIKVLKALLSDDADVVEHELPNQVEEIQIG